MSVTIFPAWCKKCGLCASFCPTGALTRDTTGAPVFSHPEKCVSCRMCELRCPDFCITVDEEKAVKDG